MNEKKRAIIVHCWEGYPTYCWYQNAKRELGAKGIRTIVPAMPDTATPTLSRWLKKLKAVVGKPDENTILIGHSVGCVTILRYLESLPRSIQIGGVVLVAGYTSDLGYKELTSFFRTPIRFQEIRKRANKFVAIHSDNDPYVSLHYADFFREQLGAKIIIKHHMGHFSGAPGKKGSTTKLSVVVQEVLRRAGTKGSTR